MPHIFPAKSLMHNPAPAKLPATHTASRIKMTERLRKKLKPSFFKNDKNLKFRAKIQNKKTIGRNTEKKGLTITKNISIVSR